MDTIPLFLIEKDHLILNDGLIVRGFNYPLLSGEGVTSRELEDDVIFWENLLLSFEDCYVSFAMDIVKNPQKTLLEHVQCHHNDPVNSVIAEERVKSLANTLMHKGTLVLGVPIFESRASFYKHIEKENDFSKYYDLCLERLNGLSDIVKQRYKEKYESECVSLTGEQCFARIYSALNDEVDAVPNLSDLYLGGDFASQLYQSELESKRDALFYNGNYYTVLNMSSLPIRSYEGAGNLLSEKIQFPARVVLNLYIPNQAKARQEINKRIQRARIFCFTKKTAESEINRSIAKSGERLLEESINEKMKYAKIGFHILLKHPDYSTLLEMRRKTIAELVSGLKGLSLGVSRYYHSQALMLSLGFFSSYSGKFFLWSSSKALSSLIPLRTLFSGSADDRPLMLFENRANGIVRFNPASNNATRWSMIVIGPSGSGKSFFMNYFVSQVLSDNPFITIIDIAPFSSYETLVNEYSGNYINLSPDIPDRQAINIFDLPLGQVKPDTRSLYFFETFFSQLAEDDSPETKGYIQRCIERTYEIYLGEQENPDLEEYRELIQEENPDKLKVLTVWQNAMPVLSDMVRVMTTDSSLLGTEFDKNKSKTLARKFNYYLEGSLRDYLNCRTNFVSESRFEVINLYGVRDNKKLLMLLYLLFRQRAWRNYTVTMETATPDEIKLYGTGYFEKLSRTFKGLLIDEFHNFGEGEAMAVVKDVDFMFRQTRTCGILVGVATQSLKDITMEGSTESTAILQNCALKIFLRHATKDNPNITEVNYIKKILGLSDEETDLLRNLRKINGQFADALVFSEDAGRGVLRYRPLPLEIWRFTTARQERFFRDNLVIELQKIVMKKIAQKISKGEIYRHVILYLTERFPQGITHLTEEQRGIEYTTALTDLTPIVLSSLQL